MGEKRRARRGLDPLRALEVLEADLTIAPSVEISLSEDEQRIYDAYNQRLSEIESTYADKVQFNVDLPQIEEQVAQEFPKIDDVIKKLIAQTEFLTAQELKKPKARKNIQQ